MGMEFARTAENDAVEVFEATEAQEIAGKVLDAALKAFAGRQVLGAGFDGGRLYLRLAKEASS